MCSLREEIYIIEMPLINEDFVVNVEDELSVNEFLIPHGFELSAVGVLNVPQNFPNSKRRFIDGENFDRVLVDYVAVCGKEDDYKNTVGKVYAIVFDGKIVKIGQTSNTLKDRFVSYACGTREYRKRGTCSVTNYHLMESAYAVLKSGGKVEVYSYTIPMITKNINVFGKKKKVMCKVAHEYENTLLGLYETQVGRYPVLSSNG